MISCISLHCPEITDVLTRPSRRSFLLLSSCLLANAVHAAGQGDGSVIELGEQTVVATAQEETKQAPGVSIITAEDIAKRPPSNDLSQIIRTMPGST